MLQRNAIVGGRQAHVAHAALIGLHTICCGMPVLAVALTALAGATSGVVLLSRSVGHLHHILHAHEVWILLLSATLVIVGGVLEVSARRGGGRFAVPWLYAFSVACFLLNVAILAVHRV
jgi:hypothetical protein